MNKLRLGLQRAALVVLTGLIKLAALLPLSVLYIFSDVLAALTYHIVRYRRKVVHANLIACFPGKSKVEIRKIEHRFYRNFTDYVFETVKLMHISNNQMMRRMTFGNVEAMDAVLAEGRDVVIYFSHSGNWEWATSVRLHSRFADNSRIVFSQIYRPLRNAVFDKLMLRLRSRFGTRCIAKFTSLREFVRFRREGLQFECGFMSDQKPSHNDPVRIVSLFGRPTAVITGTETLARRMDTAVFYWDMSKPSRGHYHIEVIPMAGHAAETAPDELTVRYFELLQANINRQPDLWLWSHKRWKTSPPTWADADPATIITSTKQSQNE